ncbi:ATP-binding protein [Streptomyces sp. NPDC059590]|uniref:ATP-binding protein n=1 Tax=Streptomyces sp. NPDC059590 TaxID=3346877 RepID=UPI0036A184EC
MNSEISPAQGVSSQTSKPVPTETAPTRHHTTHTSHTTHPRFLREFSMRFTSSEHGARLARRLVSLRLDAWGHPYDGHANETLTLITAELTSNAVRHGHTPGRGFHLRLTEAGDTLRVEVSDTRAERVPLLSAHEPPGDVESGRGLLIVAQLASRWAVTPRTDSPGKTTWAELCLP